MPNSNDVFDLLIVGGGLAGASLGRSMVLAGFRVLIIEKEVKFRDRIRGEVLLPWGSVEAKELGIYDSLLETCAQEAAREHFYYSGKASEPRELSNFNTQGDVHPFLLSSRDAGSPSGARYSKRG